MYLKDITVPIPFEQGRIVIRREKAVEMELSRTYSEEIKSSRVRRKVIGQIAPLYTDRMYPNENYFALVKNDVPAEIRDAFLLRCAKKQEIDELKKDPAAMQQRLSAGIQYLKEKGIKAAKERMNEGNSSLVMPVPAPWYITDEHDLNYVMKVFSDLYSMMEAYAMKHPDSITAPYKVRMFNRILNELKMTLPDHRAIQGLELIEEPVTEKSADGTSVLTGMSNSDVLMLLSWYRNAIRGG